MLPTRRARDAHPVAVLPKLVAPWRDGPPPACKPVLFSAAPSPWKKGTVPSAPSSCTDSCSHSSSRGRRRGYPSRHGPARPSARSPAAQPPRPHGRAPGGDRQHQQRRRRYRGRSTPAKDGRSRRRSHEPMSARRAAPPVRRDAWPVRLGHALPALLAGAPCIPHASSSPLGYLLRLRWVRGCGCKQPAWRWLLVRHHGVLIARTGSPSPCDPPAMGRMCLPLRALPTRPIRRPLPLPPVPPPRCVPFASGLIAGCRSLATVLWRARESQ